MGENHKLSVKFIINGSSVMDNHIKYCNYILKGLDSTVTYEAPHKTQLLPQTCQFGKGFCILD